MAEGGFTPAAAPGGSPLACSLVCKWLEFAFTFPLALLNKAKPKRKDGWGLINSLIFLSLPLPLPLSFSSLQSAEAHTY